MNTFFTNILEVASAADWAGTEFFASWARLWFISYSSVFNKPKDYKLEILQFYAALVIEII